MHSLGLDYTVIISSKKMSAGFLRACSASSTAYSTSRDAFIR